MYKIKPKTILNTAFIFKNFHNIYSHPINNNKLPMISKSQKIMLRKSRSEPSSSLNLKEVLMEKIPIHYDLLRNFRREHGTTTVNNITVNDLYSGLSGIKTIIKETAEMHPKFGVTYRGVTMPGIINLLPHRGHFPSPESIFWLLLTGDVPTELQTRSLIIDWALRRQKRNNWLSECATVLKALPQRLGAVEKLSIMLMSLDSTDKHMKDSSRTKIMSHEHWEYTFEDGMDLLAVLPSFLGLLKSPGEFVVSSSDESDWVDLFLQYLENSSDNSISSKTSLGDFLRLFIGLNADDNGGNPSFHVSQIIGSSQHEFGKAIAALLLATANEPSTGTLVQCQDFQEKIQRLLGPNPRTNILKGLVRAFIEKSNNNCLPGYEKSNYPNLGYHVLDNFAKEVASQDPQVQLSMDIKNVVDSLPQQSEEHLVPEKNSIVCPLFKFHGLHDMELNQGIIGMSRALGAVASIIWSRIINLPVENPQSCSTYHCFESIKKLNEESRRDKVIVIPPN